MYAQFRYVYYVYYNAEARKHTEADPVPVHFTQKYDVDKDPIINTDDVPFTTEEGEALTGWSYTWDGSQPVRNHIDRVTGDIKLFPIVRNACWITYNSNGGTVIKPGYVLSGDATVPPEEPVRAGYTFDGWYEDEGLNRRFYFESSLNKNITLYAKWREAPTTYTVVYWKQKATDRVGSGNDDKEYDYAGSVKRTATTGSTVNVTGSDTSLAYTSEYTVFSYNYSKQTNAVVKADGSTVLNVYYDRKVMTIDFRHTATGAHFQYRGLYGSTLENNGYTWPKYDGYGWYNQTDGFGYTFLDDFTFTDRSYNTSTNTMYLRSRTQAAGTPIRHYTEELDGSYKLAIEVNASSGSTNFTMGNKYTGFTVDSYRNLQRDYSIDGPYFNYTYRKLDRINKTYLEALSNKECLSKEKSDEAAEAIKKKRRFFKDKKDIRRFFIKLGLLIALIWILFGLLFGVSPVKRNDMFPRLSPGDLMLYYKLDKKFHSGDLITYKKDGELLVGWVMGVPGETVDIKADGTIYINGSLIVENEIFYKTGLYDSGVAFPVTLGPDEVFVLADNREGAKDSRYYGAISFTDVKGKVISALRRSIL